VFAQLHALTFLVVGRWSFWPDWLLSALIHACMNSQGELKSKGSHDAMMFAYIIGITAPPVNRCTMGYFKSRPSLRPSDMAILLK
jgi:hypothetical protein